ncbi:MAG: G5 domain-containing protein [Finegoldia magna]|uniref:G5 domain-containing protein n=1 Tax=Finegoldia magna TaxID=1260 RepID=UPI00242FCD2C|nr:G5 domain-containing protein [Finegoldia magna]MBS5970853.1 G5 domain-containing protein [Finegoldia magna]
MKINKRLLMAALASAVIVSAPQVKTYADTQIDDTKAVTEKLIDNQLAKAAQNADQKNSEKAQAENTADADEKQKQQESSELKEEKEINSKKTGFGSQALNHPAQATAVSNVENEADNSGLEMSEQNQPEAQKAQEEVNEPNYTDEEKEIKDYSGSERYRETDLQPGDVSQELKKTDEKVEKDGFKFELKNPSATSPSKTEYGWQITIDKKTGQRTYTKIYVTDSGLIPVDPGEKSMIGQGDKLTPESTDVTYKPNENTEITASRSQRNLSYEASEETLKHINNKDNSSTSFGMKDNYTQDNPRVKFFGGSFALGYKVNPWPNENDKLELMKLNGEYNEKVFVQGQDIDTGIKVENVDENAKERLVGQVYHPVTGKVVPGASAYIDDNGKIHIKMPEGALKLDGGKYVVNENSIFAKDPDYKGLTHLDVKFFARPRTAEEFKKIAETPDDSGDTGTYVETGAGTADINHKGNNITIDKQGIDRYDHYNLIGGFNINLDDTRYYDQEFKDGEGNKIDPNDSTSVNPGKKSTIRILDPSTPGGTQKTGTEMDDAYRKGEATGKLKEEYLIAANKKIARELGISYDELMKEENKDKRWVIDGKSDNISYFDITAPKNAKAGDTIALPVEYTYTNGSTDTRWFHFVVQESTLNKPEYEAKVNFPSEKQNSPVIVPNDEKKLSPDSYSLKEGINHIDDHGNEWTVSIDKTTGQVTAKPKNPGAFNGGEKLKVPVIAHYKDPLEPDVDVTEETTAEFIIKERANMTARYNAKAGKAGDVLSSMAILNSEDEFNRKPTKFTLSSNAYKDDKGNIWKVSIDKDTGRVTAIVPDGENIDGALLNVPVIAHYFEGDTEVGTRETEAQFVASGTKNTIVHKEEIPFETKVEVVNDLQKGEWRYKKVGDVELKGKPGSKETTYTIKDSKIVDTKVDEIKPENAVIEVGSKDFVGKVEHVEEIPFKYEVKEVDTLKKGEYEIVKPGKVGTKTTTWKIVNSEVDGEPTVTTVEAEDAIINVGKGTNNGTHTITEKVEVQFETIIEFDDSLKPGEQRVTQEGELGEKTRTNTLTIEDGQVTKTKEGEYTQTKAPVNRIIKVGRNTEGTHTYEEKIPFKYNISYDPNLKSGEYVIDVEGKEGTKTTTWTIKNSEIVGDPSVETTNPVDAVIRVGQKDYTGEFSHEVTEKIPFTVRIIEDETLEAGKSEVVTQGKPGEKTTKYTQAIKNGEADGELKSEETKRTEPVEHVIRVGKKPATNSVTKESTVPVDIVYKYDPNLDVTVAKQGTFTPGEVKTVVTNEYNPETGKIESKEETVVKNATQEIIVGTKKYTGVFENEITEVIPYETKVKFDETLEPGTVVVDAPGKLGEQRKKFIQHFENGVQISTEEQDLGKTEPEDRVVRVGYKTSGTYDHKEKIPFGYKVVYDPELKAGEYQEVTPGKVGERTTTWTIVNSKVVGDPTVVETKPVDAVIKVGSKDFTGTFETKKTDFIEFEIEYIVDNSLEPGTTEVIQKGELGEEETTVTHTIKNGEVTDSKEGDPVQTKAPSKRIVKVGAAKSNGTYEYTNKIPYDVEVRVNPNLKKGEHKVVKKGEPGEEKYTLTIENSKVTNTSGASIIKTPIKEIIEVGDANFTGSLEYVDKDPIPFETEIIVDPSLAPNQIVEDQKGELGEQETKITRTITNGESGEEVRGETKVTKEPVTRKLRIGSKTNGQYKETETIPFEVEVRKDPSLKKGEWKYNEINGVKQTGESGLRERTLTIENSQITYTSEYTTVREPKKAVILVGDEDFTGVVTHTEHFEIPFEVEVRYNSELPAGTSKEIQKGVQGSYDIEFNQKIKNGAPDGDLLKVESNRVEANKHIIEVGTKVETPENQYSKDVEVEIEYVYDDTKDKGVVETGELTPGKVETRVVDKYNTETGKVEQTTEQVVTKAKQKVIVGTKDFTGKYEYSKTCPIPFEVEIIEDDTLEKGETVVDQKGVPGSKTTKYEQDIKNGQPDGEARQISEETTKEPVKHIIRVGTKAADPTEGETTNTIEREIPYETKVIYDETLEAGIQKIENEGKPGKEKVTITQKVKDSKPVGDPTETTKTITEKEDRIVRIGVKPVEKIVELGHDTEYRYNPNLPAGETKVIEEGSNGSVKYTTTFNKETGKLEVKEERTEPKNKIVEYGSKTDAEFKFESEQAFDIIIRENPNLEAGKTKVIQEGIVGKTETTVKIENSKEVSRDTKTITEKQDKIIEIGTKNVCEIPPVNPEDPKDPEKPGEDPKDPTEDETTKTVEREIPYETKVIYDETLEAGFQKIEKEGKIGKEKVTITTKIVDGKLVTTESTEKIEDKEDRVVRIGVKPVVKEVELGHDTEYRHNPDLKEGETKVIEEGSNGSVKYTTIFNKGTGKLEVTEERVEPKNKVVEYGSKTEGEFKFESEQAYDIIIRENPNLEAGKTKVIQEGIVGKTETTVKIENSKEVSRDTKTITEKQDKIIEIGTKNVCEIPPVDPDKPNPDPDKPGKPGDKDPENPEKPGDKDPEKPGKPGDKDPETPGKPGEQTPGKPGEQTPGKPGEETPGKPGEQTPGKPGEETPGKPGEQTPGKPGEQTPGKPGEQTPGKPGEQTPGKPGEETPEKPGEETPGKPGEQTPGKTPENNGKTPDNSRGDSPNKPNKTPKTPETTEKEQGNNKEKADTPYRKSGKKLPKSGSESEIMTLAMSGLLAAAAFVGLKKKRKDQ